MAASSTATASSAAQLPAAFGRSLQELRELLGLHRPALVRRQAR